MTGEGASWRALPERFGPWNTVWRRFARWRDQGVFEAMSRAGPADERLHRYHGHSSPAARGGRPAGQRGQRSADVALGRSRGGFSTKLHVRAFANGIPLAFALTGASTTT